MLKCSVAHFSSQITLASHALYEQSFANDVGVWIPVLCIVWYECSSMHTRTRTHARTHAHALFLIYVNTLCSGFGLIAFAQLRRIWKVFTHARTDLPTPHTESTRTQTHSCSRLLVVVDRNANNANYKQCGTWQEDQTQTCPHHLQSQAQFLCDFFDVGMCVWCVCSKVPFLVVLLVRLLLVCLYVVWCGVLVVS